MPVLSRPLRPGEDFLRRLHDEGDGSGTPCVMLRLEGALDRARLDAALRQLQTRHGALRAVLRPGPHGMQFELPENYAPIPCEWIETADRMRWIVEARRLVRTPFLSADLPLIRVVVLHDPAANVTDLLICGHHAASDAVSYFVLYWDLLRLYAANPTVATTVSHEEFLVERQLKPHGPRWRKLLLVWRWTCAAWRVWRLPRVSFAKQPLDSDHISVVVWPAELMTQVSAAARRQETTVYGVLAAGTLIAIAGECDGFDKQLMVSTPVNIRGELQPLVSAREIGCYVTTFLLRTSVSAAASFWDLARRCRRNVDEFIEGDGPIVIENFVRRRRNAKPPGRTNTCSPNYLGVIPTLPDSSPLRLTEFASIVNDEGMDRQVVVRFASVAGRLNVTLQSRWFDQERAERFLARLQDVLARNCEPAGTA